MKCMDQFRSSNSHLCVLQSTITTKSYHFFFNFWSVSVVIAIVQVITLKFKETECFKLTQLLRHGP